VAAVVVAGVSQHHASLLHVNDELVAWATLFLLVHTQRRCLPEHLLWVIPTQLQTLSQLCWWPHQHPLQKLSEHLQL
jgi:hypothetical protein